jgi:predicted transcriptional regulator
MRAGVRGTGVGGWMEAMDGVEWVGMREMKRKQKGTRMAVTVAVVVVRCGD